MLSGEAANAILWALFCHLTQSGQLNTGRSKLEELLEGGARLTAIAHAVWGQFVRPGDRVVDATAGNGADSLFLAKAVGPSGHLTIIDIQVSGSLRSPQWGHWVPLVTLPDQLVPLVTIS
jgi:hypothetical protein